MDQTLAPSPRRRGLDRPSFIAGLAVAILINGGGLGTLWFMARYQSRTMKKDVEVYVDAKLVRFGVKRDLSFLPHVQATPKPPEVKNTIKIADDPDKPKQPKKPEEKTNKDLSKLAERFKNLREDPDDRVTKEAAQEGDPKGLVGGTAAEASGDPYILEIVAAVVSRWSVPTMLSPGELARLQAAACLKIGEDGKLLEFRIVEPSGNNLFDGSLNATLGSISELPRPHGRFARNAKAGKLCPVFSKQ